MSAVCGLLPILRAPAAQGTAFHMLHPLGEKHRAGHTACVLSVNPQQPLEAHCSLPVLQMTRLTLSKTKRLARSTELVGGTAGLRSVLLTWSSGR